MTRGEFLHHTRVRLRRQLHNRMLKAESAAIVKEDGSGTLEVYGSGSPFWSSKNVLGLVTRET